MKRPIKIIEDIEISCDYPKCDGCKKNDKCINDICPIHVESYELSENWFTGLDVEMNFTIKIPNPKLAKRLIKAMDKHEDLNIKFIWCDNE